MLLPELATRLAAQGLTSGYLVSRGFLPATPDAVIALYETGGTAPELFLGTSPPIDRPAVQIVVRGEPHDYATPRLTIEKIYQAMVSWGAFVQDNVRYLTCIALQAPFPFDRDELERVKFSVNFLVYKEQSPTS